MSGIVLTSTTGWTLDIMLQASGLPVEEMVLTAKHENSEEKRTRFLVELGLEYDTNFDPEAEVTGRSKSPAARDK